MLAAIEGLGYRGLVVEAMGGGSVPPAWTAQLDRLAAAMPVVYTPRTFTGPTLRSTYGGAGGELHLRRMGLTPGGMLDGLKARLLLGLLLACEADTVSMTSAWEMFDAPRSRGDRPEFVAPPATRRG